MGKTFSTGLLTDGIAQDSSNNIGIGGAASGSYKLQVTGATNLNGALSGTSATFSGSVTSNGTLVAGLANGNIRLKGSADGFLGVGETNGTLYLADWATGAKGLSIVLATGAATFSSSVAVGTSVFANNYITDPTTGNATTNGTVYALNSASITNSFGIGIGAIRNSAYDMWFQTGPANGGGYRWYIGTSEKMTMSNTGNLGIGAISPGALLHTYSSTNGAEVARFEGAYAGSGSVVLARFSRNGNAVSNVIRYSDTAGLIQYGSTTGHDTAFITNDTERMRITSGGQLMVGGTLGLGGRVVVFNEATGISIMDSSNNGGLMRFYNVNAVQIGSITTDASSTFYNTSSDYRLKEDLKEVKGLEKVSAINVYDYKWKNSELRTDGVIAHELQEVLPYAVTGQKDDKEMQSVDYSKIVPILVKAIQEQQAEIEELKALIAAK